jgi:hypothetical protein
LLKCANSALPILEIALLLTAIGALIWTVRRSGIFPAQLNNSELIRGSLAFIAFAAMLIIGPANAIGVDGTYAVWGRGNDSCGKFG